MERTAPTREAAHQLQSRSLEISMAMMQLRRDFARACLRRVDAANDELERVDWQP